MTTQELINKLSEFDPNLPVTISDGYRYHFYNTNNLEIKVFEDLDNNRSLDIGLGDCFINDDEEEDTCDNYIKDGSGECNDCRVV